MDFKELKKKSGMTSAQIYEFSGIPVRSQENWTSEKQRRNPPSYVINLLKYKMEKEGIIKEESDDDISTKE